MKTKNYLNKVSRHLFQITGKEVTYMKVLVNEDKFRILRFNQNLELISDQEYSIDSYHGVSSKGKEYVMTELKNWVLFYKGYDSNYNEIKTIKHFKKFKSVLNDYQKMKINK